jgi:hypothetical protein
MRAAYHAETALGAQAQLETLAAELERTHPGAAASLREGLAETLTVLRLGVPPTLARTLRSTNCVESMIEICRNHSRNVNAGATGRWRCAGAPLAWSKPAPNSAASTATYICGRCEPRSNGMSRPKMSEPPSTITPATPPNDHRTVAEKLQSPGHPPSGKLSCLAASEHRSPRAARSTVFGRGWGVLAAGVAIDAGLCKPPHGVLTWLDPCHHLSLGAAVHPTAG